MHAAPRVGRRGRADPLTVGEPHLPPLPARRVGWSELLAHPEVQERAERAGAIGIMAFHGGVEAGTAEIAESVARRAGASLYAVVQPAGLRWHVPSVEVDPGVSPRLRSWLAGVTRVVTVHGYMRRDRPFDVLLGGADLELARAAGTILRPRLRDLRVVDDPASIPPALAGRHPANPVNLAPAGGVQIELPVRARRGAAAATVVDALADLVAIWAGEAD